MAFAQPSQRLPQVSIWFALQDVPRIQAGRFPAGQVPSITLDCNAHLLVSVASMIQGLPPCRHRSWDLPVTPKQGVLRNTVSCSVISALSGCLPPPGEQNVCAQPHSAGELCTWCWRERGEGSSQMIRRKMRLLGLGWVMFALWYLQIHIIAHNQDIFVGLKMFLLFVFCFLRDK